MSDFSKQITSDGAKSSSVAVAGIFSGQNPRCASFARPQKSGILAVLPGARSRLAGPLPQSLDLSVVEDDFDDSEASGGESGARRPQRALSVRADHEALALAPVLGAGERPGAREPEEVRRFRRRDQQRQRRRHEVLPPHEIVA